MDFPGSTPESRRAAIAASAKPRFKIVDCTTASLDHRLITSVDMFVPDDKEIREAVKKGMADDKPLTPEEMAELAQKELEKRLAAKQLEEMRKRTQGRAQGRVFGEEIDLQFSGKRCVGTYMNPLRGKFAGLRMNQLPVWYIDWACRQPSIQGWIKNTFLKERKRRHELSRAS